MPSDPHAAVEHWRASGVPDSPRAWIIQRALALATNDSERRSLARRLREVGAAPPDGP